MKVTKIEKQAKRDRFNIYLDGVYRLSLACRVTDEKSLEEGQTLSEKEIEILKEVDQEYRAYNRAILILSYRANTATELRRKLLKNFEEQAVAKVIAKLHDQGLLDDADFAQRYAEQSKKGKRLVGIELMKKGIDKELIESALGGKDEKAELENAIRLAEKVLKKYEKEDLNIRKQKLYENLTRKGFSYDVYKEIIKEFDI